MDDPDRVVADEWLGVTAFVPDGSDYSPAVLVERLRDALPGCDIRTCPQGIEIAGGEWRVWLYESHARPGDPNWAEFAEVYGDHPRAAEMTAPGRRVEFAGRSADAGDEGGPAVAAVAGVLSGFRGVFVFDGQAAEEL